MATKRSKAPDEVKIPTLAEVEETFGLFVSPVEGHLVARFGTGTTIGAKREILPAPETSDRATLNWLRRGAGRRTVDPSTIVALTHQEARRYRREYTRAIKRDGALRERTAREYHSQLAASMRVEAKHRAEAAAAKAKASKTEGAQPGDDDTTAES